MSKKKQVKFVLKPGDTWDTVVKSYSRGEIITVTNDVKLLFAKWVSESYAGQDWYIIVDKELKILTNTKGVGMFSIPFVNKDIDVLTRGYEQTKQQYESMVKSGRHSMDFFVIKADRYYDVARKNLILDKDSIFKVKQTEDELWLERARSVVNKEIYGH